MQIEEEEDFKIPRRKYQHFVPTVAPLTLTTTQLGRYRIQNNSAAGYLIYIGVNELPSFENYDFFQASLPITIPYPAGSDTLYIVIRYRNTYGVTSINISPWIIKLDGYIAVPPPQNVNVYPRANNIIRIVGEYPTRLLEKHPADKLKIWVDTDPDIDPATLTINIVADSFTFDFGSYSAGDHTVNAALYRTADDNKSEVVILQVSIPASPDAPFGI